jgi:hypothetical protein
MLRSSWILIPQGRRHYGRHRQNSFIPIGRGPGNGGPGPNYPRKRGFSKRAGLTRLLRFLTEKHLAGETETLKEYSIGVDALERPESFDPKKESIVRLQMSRLRQKLAEILNSPRSLIIAIEEPPFVQLEGFGVYRELTLNRWDDIEKSSRVAAIQEALHSPAISPNYYYAPMGEVSAAFLLGGLLEPRVPGLSLVGSRGLSWRQIGNSDVIYLGVANFIADLVKGLPVQPKLAEVSGGISNPGPEAGETGFYADQLPSGPAGDGEAYALITHLPGPAGTGTFTTFSSNSSASRLAAVQYFTDPSHAETLIERMTGHSRQIPQYYQILIRVGFKDGVPTRTSLVLCHELRP